MKILVISQYFFPESFRINDICLEIKKMGHDVTVLTAIPNYPKGSYYKGYGLFKKRKEIWNGIKILRLPIISRGNTNIRLFLNYYSFVVSGWIWNLFTRTKTDLVFSFEVSPIIQVLVGKWFSKKRDIPHYLYLQDLWPETLEVMGNVHNKLVLNHYRNLSTKIYNSCNKIFATSPSLVKYLSNQIATNIPVMYWPQHAEDYCKPVLDTNCSVIPKDNRFKIVFAGNIGYAQGLEILPKVAEKLSDEFLFIIVGDGRYKRQMIIDTKEVNDMFLYIDHQPSQSIPEIICSCDVAFLSYMNNSLFNMMIPAKLQTYMACGIPIVASASGETKRIIDESKCGICCDIGDVGGLVDAIRQLKNSNLELYRNNAINYANIYFNRNNMLKFIKEEILEDYETKH